MGFSGFRVLELTAFGGRLPLRGDVSTLYACKGPAQVMSQVCVYGVKVNFYGSENLKIVIYVENCPRKRSFRLADYRPLLDGSVS